MKNSLVLLLLLAIARASTVSADVPGDNLSATIGWNLQRNVSVQILADQRTLAPNCKRSKIVRAVVSAAPQTLRRGLTMGFSKMQWSERGTVDRCGVSVFYLVHFDMRGSVGTFKIDATKLILLSICERPDFFGATP